MASLPVISGREAVKAFEKVGFIFHRQKGTHMISYHANGRHLSVPDHKEHLITKNLTAEPCER
jgi:predicted RNA binding protein YcfA (HicA-like mRNA interferase family)